MSELPKGWELAKLKDTICHNGLISDGDWVESKDQDPNGNVRLIQLADIGDGDFKDKSSRYLTSTKAQELNCGFLDAGDLLIARMPDPLGRACIFPGIDQDAVTVVDVCFIKFGKQSALSNSLLEHWINSPQIRGLIAANATGTTRKRITRKKLEQFQLPIPPQAEQTRIVKKLDKALAQVDAIKARLDRVPDILKHFRQSVLAAAVSGKLTEEWREKFDLDSSRELSQLLANRSSVFKKLGKKNTELKRVANPVKLEELPKSWVYSTLDPFLDIARSGMKTGPFGSLLKKGEHQTQGVPVLGIENIDCGRFVKGSKIHITESKADELNTYNIHGGDLIISRSGSVGDICVVPHNLGEMRFSTNLMRISFFSQSINSDFFCYLFLGSNIVLQQVSELCKGSTRDFLNQKILGSIHYPIPPTNEQTEIVRLVEQYFKFADTVEAQVKKAQQRVDNLTQSILAKAFRGELVKQNPEDEPAEVLLEKIKQARLEAEALEKAAKKAARAKKKATA